jgi:CRP-like cAMP-binding protein
MVLAFRSSVQMTAVSACDLFVLEKGAFDEVISHYPGLAHRIETNAQRLVDVAVAKVALESSVACAAVSTSTPDSTVHVPRRTPSICVSDGDAHFHIEDGTLLSDVALEAGVVHYSATSSSGSVLSALFKHVVDPNQGLYPNGQHTLAISVLTIVAMALSITTVALAAGLASQSVGLLLIIYTLDLVCISLFLRDVAVYTTTVKRGSRTQLWLLIVQGIAAFPIELCFLNESDKVVAGARFNRLLRVAVILVQFRRLVLTHATRVTSVRFTQFVTMGVLAGHVGTCLWMMLDGGTRDDSYCTALYWMLATSTSTGYGDEYPSSGRQRLFAMAIMLLGQSGFGLASATIAATLANLATSRLQAQSHLNAISRYLDENEIKDSVQSRVREHFRQTWVRYEGLNDRTAFKSLPRSLQAEINDARYKQLLCEFPLFENVSEGLTHEVMLKLRPIFVLPNETIITKGDIGRKTYFILKGVVDVMADDETRVAAQLSAGQYFGEVGMLFSRPRLSSVRAASHCELVSLSRDDLGVAGRHYPAFQHLLNDILADKAHFAAAKMAVGNNNVAQAAPFRQTNIHNVAGQATVLRNPAQPRTAAKTSNKVAPARTSNSTQKKPEYSYRQTLLGSAATRGWLSCMLMPTTINPFSNAAYVWEVVQIALSTVVVFTVPFYAAFSPQSTELWVFHMVIDVVFLIDIYIKMHTAYIDSAGELRTQPHETVSHYAQTGLITDLLTTIPVNLVVSIAAPAYGPIARFNRLFRACVHPFPTPPFSLKHLAFLLKSHGCARMLLSGHARVTASHPYLLVFQA